MGVPLALSFSFSLQNSFLAFADRLMGVYAFIVRN